MWRQRITILAYVISPSAESRDSLREVQGHIGGRNAVGDYLTFGKQARTSKPVGPEDLSTSRLSNCAGPAVCIAYGTSLLRPGNIKL